MVLITRAATNTIDLTLSELVTLANPYYLFVFTNKETSEVSKCLLTDSSVYQERFNRFQLTEGSNVTLIPGDYILQVYETATNSTTIPDSGLLETDIVRVGINLLTETEYTTESTAIVYESTD